MSKFLFILLALLVTNTAMASFDTVKAVNYIHTVYKVNKQIATEIVTAVGVASTKHRIDPYIVLAVIQKESGFKVRATNGKSKGLMQLYIKHKETVKLLEGKSPFNIEANINGGVAKLNICKTKDNRPMLVCYHGSSNGYREKVIHIANNLKTIF